MPLVHDTACHDGSDLDGEDTITINFYVKDTLDAGGDVISSTSGDNTPIAFNVAANIGGASGSTLGKNRRLRRIQLQP